MSIITDSVSVDDPKDPENCTVFKLFEIIADKSDVLELEKNIETVDMDMVMQRMTFLRLYLKSISHKENYTIIISTMRV